MTMLADARTLFHLVASPIRGDSHAERLESFYSKQADGYDSFRERLLKGRRELCERLPLDPGASWIDLGSGTGANLEYAADRVSGLSRVTLVDLSPSLLEVARRRVDARGWRNVEVVQADATIYQPLEPADVVTFSYSLTMIPDWFGAVDHALSLLRPGGILGVTDFYVTRKYMSAGGLPHGWFTRTFWPAWFAFDNVFLTPDLLPYLQSKLETVELDGRRSKVPYLPLARVPYFVFVGRKRATADCQREIEVVARERVASDPAK
jgi:S-adenosylmethionine-diacylgycerolhomoserine-N-methlytransferase